MHLIVFSDGTWNTPDDEDNGLPSPTNVVKMRNALAPYDIGDQQQKTYYHSGVGTNGTWWDRVAGGGMGDGLNDNIKSAYRWLVANFTEGDKIWLFGFSRGAYTVRSLAGMIGRCGLLNSHDIKLTDKETWAAVDDLFNAYRAKITLPPTAKRSFHGDKKKSDFPKASINIHFIGVWETVGALGVPDDMALLNLIDDPARHSFHDTDLNDIVLNARHAIAIDEQRQSFTPTLWTHVEDRKDTVKQVWFPGVHSDIGGGYGSVGLSDGALQWMIEETKPLGLVYREKVLSQLAPDPHGFLHDSIQGIFKSLKIRPREVPHIVQASVDATILHCSALARHDDPPLSQGDYWKETSLPSKKAKTVDIFSRQLWNFTGIYMIKDTEYQLSATGEWLDSSIVCGPAGTDDGKFQLREALHIASSVWGKAETIYTKLTGNTQIDFWYTRRLETHPWFSLIGMVANGFVPTPDPEEKLAVAPHEMFLIGKKRTFTPKASGYLYAFANDAWQAYANNKGSVQLTVQS